MEKIACAQNKSTLRGSTLLKGILEKANNFKDQFVINLRNPSALKPSQIGTVTALLAALAISPEVADTAPQLINQEGTKPLEAYVVAQPEGLNVFQLDGNGNLVPFLENHNAAQTSTVCLNHTFVGFYEGGKLAASGRRIIEIIEGPDVLFSPGWPNYVVIPDNDVAKLRRDTNNDPSCNN